MELFTIGYEGFSSPEFFTLLRENSVEVLVDVRELPLSRKPGFSKTALAMSALSNGLTYQHYPALGCPREIRHPYREHRDWERYTQEFLQYLDSQQAAVEALVNEANSLRCCLLCFEADADYCHRSYVAQRAEMAFDAQFTVKHLSKSQMSSGRLIYA